METNTILKIWKENFLFQQILSSYVKVHKVEVFELGIKWNYLFLDLDGNMDEEVTKRKICMYLEYTYVRIGTFKLGTHMPILQVVIMH